MLYTIITLIVVAAIISDIRKKEDDYRCSIFSVMYLLVPMLVALAYDCPAQNNNRHTDVAVIGHQLFTTGDSITLTVPKYVDIADVVYIEGSRLQVDKIVQCSPANQNIMAAFMRSGAWNIDKIDEHTLKLDAKELSTSKSKIVQRVALKLYIPKTVNVEVLFI